MQEIKVETFTRGAFSEQLEEMKKWFLQKEMKKDQIISISINETHIHDGDSVLVVFYRSETRDP